MCDWFLQTHGNCCTLYSEHNKEEVAFLSYAAMMLLALATKGDVRLPRLSSRAVRKAEYTRPSGISGMPGKTTDPHCPRKKERLTQAALHKEAALELQLPTQKDIKPA
jgi:hypothetical protein